MKVAIDGQIEELKNALPNVEMDNIMITDSGVTDEIRKYFVEQVSKLVDSKVIRCTPAGCVIASNCGPGTIGLLFIKK
jgi:fatty acid-binding protein DegV